MAGAHPGDELPATFFVPGHTAEAFPESVESILAAGRELAIIPARRAHTKNGAARSRAWSCWKARSNPSCQQVARMGDVVLALTAAEEG